MRTILMLLAAIAVLGWLGYELRDRHRPLSRAFLGVAGALAVLLLGALFGLYGR